MSRRERRTRAALSASQLADSCESARLALRGRPDDIKQFALAGFGAIPRKAFFNPDNLSRIMAQAASNAA